MSLFKTPPSLEEFDPLNPGEWQLGAGGKILPRLPEGTRVGKLVMGKYGLYDPQLRKRVEVYSKALLDGKKSEEAGPFDRAMTRNGEDSSVPSASSWDSITFSRLHMENCCHLIHT
ncbi:hypothetical protein COOONC_05126 [Cooperia oncophora]